MEERFSQCPLWLEYSGLPAYLNQKARGAGWLVFKAIVERDCEENQVPGIVEISLEELARRTGLEATIVERTVKKLKKEKVVGCFLPDNAEEAALLRINVPLKTPVSGEDVRKEYADVFPPGRDFFRYFDTQTQEADEEKDAELKEVVDLYFNALGLRINAFILDELRIIRRRFNLDSIRKTFERAKRHNIRSLHWVVRELLREQKKHAKSKEN
jgi:hypothetical protein